MYDRTEFTEYQSFGSILFGSVFLGNTEPNFSDKTKGPRANLSPLFTTKTFKSSYWEAFSNNYKEYFIEKFKDFKNF